MRCTAIEADLSAFLDGELTRDRSQAVTDHLADCSRCSDEFQSLRRLICWAHMVPEVDPPFALHGRILSAVSTPVVTPLDRAWAALRGLGSARPMVWAVSAGATAVLAVAIANPRQPASVTITELSATPPRIAQAPPQHSQPPAHAAARAPASVLRETQLAVRPEAQAPKELAQSSLKATVPAPRTVPQTSAAPARELRLEAQPLTTDLPPTPEPDARVVEPAPWMKAPDMPVTAAPGGSPMMVKEPGASHESMGMMGMAIEPAKGGSPSSANAPGQDDGLAEYREFLKQTSPRKQDEPKKDTSSTL